MACLSVVACHWLNPTIIVPLSVSRELVPRVISGNAIKRRDGRVGAKLPPESLQGLNGVILAGDSGDVSRGYVRPEVIAGLLILLPPTHFGE